MMDRAGEPQTERDANRSCLSRTKWEGMAARGGGGAKKLISPAPKPDWRFLTIVQTEHNHICCLKPVQSIL